MYSAIDMVLDKMEKQIKKSKQKVRERRGTLKSLEKRRGTLKSLEKSGLEEPGPLEDDTAGQVRIENIEYKPMHVEEAVMQMELVDQNFLVFTNARTNRVNVLYHRKDGDYGLIQPNS